ncbi:MAG: sigma 54-interacting transcriptional regulator [Desulfovibrionaceae bacterium]
MTDEFLAQFCDAFRDAISISDRHGAIVLVNKKHAELTGIPKEQMIGQFVLDMVRGSIFDIVLNPEVVQTKQSVTRVQNISNGKQLVLEGHPVFDAKGDVDYVVTFIRDVTTLAELRAQITTQKELLETFRSLNNTFPDNTPKYPRVVNSASMRALYTEIAAIAETDATVLLLGETGVGKDVVARRLHSMSPRAEKPFIKIDCGSIPENLIETELFGYAAGSFSGANKHGKAGLIEAASMGTLFLDEIGELPMSMQSRLLRVLQDWEILRVGSTTPKHIDVRVVAATNKDLESAVAKGQFRSDLYYRLKVAVLHIPSLHRRQADILPLAHAFLGYYCDKYHKNIMLSEDAEHSLLAHHWPGNVRELENLIQGLVVTTTKHTLTSADLPFAPAHKRPPEKAPAELGALKLDGRSYKDIMKDLERMVISTAMHRYGSISEVAKHFQVDRSTIFRKVKELES